MQNTEPCDPQTDAEWQEAVDAAHVWLLVDSARQYGLVRVSGAEIDSERCQQILHEGRKHGVFPHPNAVERFFHQEAKRA